eukprot:6031540-Prorocentrum_lima.AAC.1
MGNAVQRRQKAESSAAPHVGYSSSQSSWPALSGECCTSCCAHESAGNPSLFAPSRVILSALFGAPFLEERTENGVV